MTVARDAVLESATFTTTSPHTFTFTPVGTPKAILLAIAHGTVSTDLITGAVTYGGVAMTRIPTDGFAQDTVTEVGAVYLDFLGASIPTGAQTVSITHTGSADVKWAICQSMTAATDTEVGASGRVQEDVANPSSALDTGANSSLRSAVLYNGSATLGSITAMTGMEALAAGTGHDFGNFVAVFGQQTTAATGSFTIGFTVGIEDVAMCAVAIQEVSGGATQNLTGALFTKAPTFFTGAITATGALTGSLFTKAPTFPVGLVSSSGVQALTGTLFSKTPTFPVGSLTGPIFPIRQQISHYLTGTSISAVLRVAPLEDSLVFAVVSAETTLANMTGPSGYTKAVEEQGDGVSVQIWYKRAGAAESATVTATSSASVPLRIHVFESPEVLFGVGDPLDVVASNDSSTSAVTTLATGTTATVGQADTFAIAAVAALGGDLNFLLADWSDDYTALSDHETRGLMVGFKVMTSASTAAATATWNQATAPTSHKAAAAIATFALAGPVTLPEPSPRRVSFGRIGTELNTTGTVDTVATFPVVADRLYLAFVGTSKDGAGNNADAIIPDSHGAALGWVLDESFSIGTSRRVHIFRALSASPLSAASISVTTPESACAVWWEVVEVADSHTAGTSAVAAIRQVATASTAGATFLETTFAVAPDIGNAVVGFCLHGATERQSVDLTPDVHLLLGEANVVDVSGQRTTVDWFNGVDQTFRWEWATSIHGIAIVAEIQVDSLIGGGGFPVVESLTPTTFATNTTDHQVAMPGTVDVGDLLVIIAAFDGPTITNPTGWTSLENEDSVAHARIVTVKVADGTEEGTTVNVVTSAAEAGAAQVYRISDWWGTIATGTAIGARNSQGGSASNDVPSLAPPWLVETTLWIASWTADPAAGVDTITTYPTDYTNGTVTNPGVGFGAVVASARRELAHASDDPDAFVFSANPSGSATRLLAIRPAAPVAGVSQTPNATVSNVGWDTAPLAGQAIHTYIATDDTDYITVTVP